MGKKAKKTKVKIDLTPEQQRFMNRQAEYLDRYGPQIEFEEKQLAPQISSLEQELAGPLAISPQIRAAVQESYKESWKNLQRMGHDLAALRGMAATDSPIGAEISKAGLDLTSRQSQSEIGLAQWERDFRKALLGGMHARRGGLQQFRLQLGQAPQLGPTGATHIAPKEQWMETMNRIYGEVIGNTASGMSLGMGIGGMFGGGPSPASGAGGH